jgi:hypothetical protein
MDDNDVKLGLISKLTVQSMLQLIRDHDIGRISQRKRQFYVTLILNSDLPLQVIEEKIRFQNTGHQQNVSDRM